MKTLSILFLALFIFSIQSCDKPELRGKQSPIGEVGNSFTTGFLPGVNNAQGYISALEDGISTITVTGELVDPDLVDLGNFLAATFPEQVQMSGSMLTANFEARFTDKGIAGVFRDGEELVYCEYDAGVGSSWSATTEGELVTSTITEKTGVDDYYYGNLLIKVSEARLETDVMNDVGLEEFNLYFNHKFGFVGLTADFGANGSTSINVFSDAQN